MPIEKADVLRGYREVLGQDIVDEKTVSEMAEFYPSTETFLRRLDESLECRRILGKIR